MKGIHHLGLSVSNLVESCSFFCDLLGWKQTRKLDDYPAIFVSNGITTFTLWQTKKDSISFSRTNNVGLHHVALQLDSQQEMASLYRALEEADSVVIEFSPEPLRGGPAQHMMCIEPSGIRIEFIWSPT